MVRIAEDAGYDFNLLKGVVTVNDEQLHRVAAKIVDLAGGSVAGQADRGVGPHLQGPHRRPARVAVAGGDRAPRGAGRRGARLRPVRARARSRASRSSTIPTPRSRAPRCSPCSPSGTSSAGSTSTRSPTSWPPERRRRPQPARPGRAGRAAASSTAASGAADGAAGYGPAVLLTPRYDATPVLTVDVRGAGPHPLVQQRRRLEAPARRPLARTSGSTPAAATGGRVQDVVTHLISTNGFWALSIDARRWRGEPTRFLAAFDPVASPAQLVDAGAGHAGGGDPRAAYRAATPRWSR